jgi:quercetin dioxygenase-like cupin family protein
MKHFKRVESGIDTQPFIREIEANQECWNLDSGRQNSKPAQRETQAIPLRCSEKTSVLDSMALQSKPIAYRGLPTPMSERFPVADSFVEQLVKRMNGASGRAVLTQLRPGGTIHPHIDDRLYWLLRDRYHLVVKSSAGSYFKAGGEEVRMQEGELWWFDPTVTHSVHNDSDEWRIHIVADIMSPHSFGSFCMRLGRAPFRTLHAVGGAALRGLGLRKPAQA